MLTPIMKKRMYLFAICILVRLSMAYVAKSASYEWLRIMGYVALVPAFGFAYIWATGSRKTGPETFGQPIWWNHLRPIHSLLYFCFAGYAIYGFRQAWMFLLLDALFGLVQFIHHHTIHDHW